MDYMQTLIFRRVRNPAEIEWVTFITLNKYRKRSFLPNMIGYVFLFGLLVSVWCLWHMDNCFPNQVTLEDEEKHPDRFVGERAELFLKRLTDIGPKVVGSYENEVLAVDILRRDVSFIAQQSKNIHKIEIDVQKSTGSYYLTLSSHTFKNYYENVQSVVVKFSSHNSSPDSILLNCHFDTVPGSPGASDDGLNCAVLLEILNKLSKSKVPLKNTIIFLFNGAEENPLQASHGFITQHKWSKDVKAVINLDSAGAGGRELLFQTTANADWLVKTYAKVAPHPTGGVHGEEIFLTGLVPSDTDFRIFRDFGNIPGLDFAHVGNGYIYHTKFDTMDHIDPGVIQNTGDNILALVKEIAYSPDFGKSVKPVNNNDKSDIVYFDVFGVIMVVYSGRVAFFLNIGTALLSFYAIYKTAKFLPGSLHSLKQVFATLKQQVMGFFLSVIMVMLTAKIIDWFNCPMSWYNQPWIIMPLYYAIFAFGNALLPLMDVGKLVGVKAEKRAIFYTIGVQLMWTILLIVGTFLGNRSVFIIWFLVFPTAICSTVTAYSRHSFSVKKYIFANFFSTCIPMFYIMHQSFRVLAVFIPMSSRMGPHSQPEFTMSAIVVISGLLVMAYWIPLILVLRRPKEFLLVLLLIHVAAVVGVVGTSFGFPFSGYSSSPALQRFYILHSERTFHDIDGNIRKMDSGFFIQSLDKYGLQHVSKEFDRLKEAHTLSSQCSLEVICGSPIFSSRFLNTASYGYWISGPAPVIHQNTDLVVSSTTALNSQDKRINFVLTGPDHMMILIIPKIGVHLSGWTFDDKPVMTTRWRGRKIYMINYSHGLSGGTLEFGLDLEASGDINTKHPYVDIIVTSHYVNDKHRTDEFSHFLSKFPDWTHITAWTASYKAWIF